MLPGSYQIARVWGIPIKVHVTLILILPFLAWQYGAVTAIGLEVGIFASIVLHELGHSLVALRKGCRVREILLLPIGGAAQMEQIPERPWDEFQMALAGPLVSVLLFLILYFGGRYVPLPLLPELPINAVQYLGAVNAALAVFNLLPSFPMDGGRILRAVLSPRLGRLRATHIAARLGQLLALAFGVWACLDLPARLVGLMIAAFIFLAAGVEYRRVRIEAARRHVHELWSWPVPPPLPTDRIVVSPPPYDRDAGGRHPGAPPADRTAE